MDTEGGHYASKFVNIAKGSYEGQLVIGDSFIHPIKEFTVSEGSDIVVLQFKFCKGVLCMSYSILLPPPPRPPDSVGDFVNKICLVGISTY